jgi:hypothetical protein
MTATLAPKHRKGGSEGNPRHIHRRQERQAAATLGQLYIQTQAELQRRGWMTRRERMVEDIQLGKRPNQLLYYRTGTMRVLGKGGQLNFQPANRAQRRAR